MDRWIQANVKGEKWILLSEHKQGKDLIIPNSLDVEVVNVSCIDTASFINNLPVGAHIPDIDVEQDQISVVYVYFPIGNGEAYLTTEEWARQMTCYAPYNWGVEQAYDKQYGIYFKLYPLNDYDLESREKLYFSINNVVSFGELEKMVYVAVRFTNIPMLSDNGKDNLPKQPSESETSKDGTDYLAFFKKRSELNILNFESNRTRVAVGDTIKLEWAIAGDAVQCVLTPGDIVVESVGSFEMEIFTDTTVRLYAFGKEVQISETVTIYVDQPVITTFTSDCQDNKTLFGRRVLLSYDVSDADGMYLNQGIGRVTGNSISVLPTSATTTYTLSCMGIDKLIQKSLTITITDFLKVDYLSYSRSSRRSDGSYDYYLKWKVSNCNTIRLTTSDGQIRSTGEASGSIQFKDSSETPLTVTLYCTGTSEQVLDQIYSV